jgi:hypothetical protein
MPDAPRVALERASESDATILANPLELYTHDLSDIRSGVRRDDDVATWRVFSFDNAGPSA